VLKSQFYFQFEGFQLKVVSDYNLFDYLGFAERDNKKRKYLFVSKVLGKHYPVSPETMKRTFDDLRDTISHLNFKGNLLVVGMGETATGLGWGVFDSINHENKLYIHTTRLQLNAKRLFNFEETHSHDINQILYEPQILDHKDFLLNAKTIIIVDDEVTTGKTIMNLAHQFKALIPGVKIIPLTIVKWNNQFKNNKIFCLHKASFEYLPENDYEKNGIKKNNKKVIKHIGRDEMVINKFGRFSARKFIIDKSMLPSDYKAWRSKKILVLGTGEFNYMAYKIASLLDKKNDVFIQSTTRSPVKISGIINSKITFKDNYNPKLTSYLYNVVDKNYDIILMLAETLPDSIDPKLVDKLKSISKKVIQIYF
jgi:hypothetical protein